MKFDRRLTDEIYTSDTVRLGKNAFQAMQETIYHNGGVGTITGYYDAELSILSVSDLLLHNLNHSYASLMEQTKGSLKNLFYKKDAAFLDNARFRQLQGEGEGRILTADGAPVYVRLYKKDAVDTDGTPIWIMSVQMNWAYENLALVNESIHSALWYFEFLSSSSIWCHPVISSDIWFPLCKGKIHASTNNNLKYPRFFDAFFLYSVFSVWTAQMEIGGMFRRDAGQNAPLLRHKTKGKSRIMNQNQAKEYYKKLFVNYPDVLSVEEATTLLGFKSQTAIIRRIHQHRIRCLKVGRSFMIPKEYLIDYLLDS